MSLNGSGVYSANTSGQPVQNGETVDPDVFNALITDIATALSTAVFKDGQQTITANLPMSNYILTGLGSGLANRGYSARIGDIQDSTATFVAGGGTADAITATFVPAIAAVVDGMELGVRATAANATTTPTFAPNGLTARTIKKQGGQALAAGDIRDAGHELRLRYVAATTHWELLNPTYPTTTGFAATGSANSFTADQTIQSTDAGAAVGPKLILDRDSASPAASDVLGAIDFLGEDSGGGDETYARIQAEILDPTAATEDGTLSFYAVTAGSLASRRLRVGPGLIVGSPTGGDQGGGTVNATGYYVNGSAVPVIAAYTSTGQTITAAGLLTLAHSLGAAPKLIVLKLKCIDVGGDGGYAQNDEVFIPVSGMSDSGFAYGVNCYADATNIYVRYGSLATPFFLLNKSTGNVFNAANAKWNLLVRAYTW